MFATPGDEFQFGPPSQSPLAAWNFDDEISNGPVVRSHRTFRRHRTDLSWIPVTLFALAGVATVCTFARDLTKPRRVRPVANRLVPTTSAPQATGLATPSSGTSRTTTHAAVQRDHPAEHRSIDRSTKVVQASQPAPGRHTGEKTPAPMNEGVAGNVFKPEQLLAMCRAPLNLKARLTPIDELPAEFLGMWWMYAKRDAAGGAEIVPDRLRRFASFLITARSWQVANPGIPMAPRRFELMCRFADIEGLPSYFLMLSEDMRWVLHGPVAGRWVLLRTINADGQENDRQVYELMKP